MTTRPRCARECRGVTVPNVLCGRLMDVAHDAQTLAVALNQSALSIGNVTGAWVGGLVIAVGCGLHRTRRRGRTAGRSRNPRAYRVVAHRA